jgi:hypothetical protein
MLSFIVPTHNEDAWLGRYLLAVQTAVEPTGDQHEIIVVDDPSALRGPDGFPSREGLDLWHRPQRERTQ